MKKLLLLLVCVFFVSSMAAAQVNVTAESLAALQANHKKAMQNFGHYYMWNEKNCTFAVVGKDLVSIVHGRFEKTFYIEYKGFKIYTRLTLTQGQSPTEIVFTFDNRVTKNNITFQIKFTYTYDFGDTPGFRVSVESDKRWDIEKCLGCIACAAGKINDLYNAYKQCGTDWQCWLANYQHLIDLYNCVVHKCIPCFQNEG